MRSDDTDQQRKAIVATHYFTTTESQVGAVCRLFMMPITSSICGGLRPTHTGARRAGLHSVCTSVILGSSANANDVMREREELYVCSSTVWHGRVDSLVTSFS